MIIGRLPAMLAGEWTKIRSVRSSAWTLGLAFVLSVGVGLTDSLSVRAAIARHSALVRPDFNAADAGFVGIGFGQLCLVVFGVLLMGSEYTTGSIRAALVTMPRRGVFFTGKVAGAVLVVFPVALASTVAGYLASEAGLGSLAVPIGAPGVWPTVLGAAGALTLLCVFATGVATVLRGSTLPLAILIPVTLVLPQLMNAVPGLRTVGAYLPEQAATALMQVIPQGGPLLSPGPAAAVLVGWTVAALAGGYLVLRGRDATG